MEKARIMVVEDERIVALDIKGSLQELGYDVPAVVASGEDALVHAAISSPDLVLMDIKLKGVLNGVKAAELIRERFDIPVIYLTAYADSTTLQRAKTTDPVGYLIKPFEEQQLHITIKMALYRHQMERELRRRERWLSTMLRSIGDAVISTDARGHITLINPVAEMLTGWAREDALGVAVDDVFRTARIGTHVPTASPVAQVLDSGCAVQVTHPVLLTGINSASVPIEHRADPIGDDYGNLLGVVLTFRDISDRFQAEQMRLAAERQQREFAQALAEAASVVNGTLNLEHVLDRILEPIHRVVPGDASSIMLVQDDTAHLVRWRSHDACDKSGFGKRCTCSIVESSLLSKIAETGKARLIQDVTKECVGCSVQASCAWVRARVSAPIQVNGQTVGFLNVLGKRAGQFDDSDAMRLEAFAAHVSVAIQNAERYREINNYVDGLEDRIAQATAQLQAKYAQLDTILSNLSDGVIVTDIDGDILQVNPVAEKLLTARLSQEDAMRLRQNARALARQADTFPESVLELQNVDLQLRATPAMVSARKGEAVVVIHDVSRLKALDRMKTRFVTNISHELRTPVTTLRLYVELLRRTPQARWPQYFEAFSREADRLTQMVEDILQLSRADADQIKLNPKATSLHALVEAAVPCHQLLAQGHEVSLTFKTDAEDVSVLVDPTQMLRALDDLLSNAIQYTLPGGRVEVTTGRQAFEGQAWASIAIADTGIGIPAGELPLIFERFFRGEQPLQMQVPGSGLGLSLVKEILEQHQGRVLVESQVGEGSTFTLLIPLAT